MKSKILGLLAVGLMAGPMTSHATVMFLSDTDTDLTGTFSVTGQQSFTMVQPSQFLLLPQTDNNLVYGRNDTDSGTFFAARTVGAPDDPVVAFSVTSDAQSLSSVSGTYDNVTGGVSVYFLFSQLLDSGGDTGTFSGTFCFSAGEDRCSSDVPEPGTLVLLGLGLAGLALSRKRKTA